jgi:myo-inositol 2-dehydrogenase/D-chiro-inositol 1-dehydrogenase
MPNRKQKSDLSRRNFISKAAVFGAGLTILPRHVFGRGYIPPSETVNHVLIGCGGISQMHTGACAGALHRWIAVCDVDANRMNGRANELKGANGGQLPRTAKDYREVIGLADADIVHVCTPPHWHGPIGAAAARAGKAVWGEKPLTRTIGEGLALVDIVQRAKVPFRVNTWFRLNTTNYYGIGPAREIRRIVASGVLGWPLTVRVASGAGGIEWKVNLWSGKTNLDPQPVPPHLDWDFYCGPSPLIPYHPHRCHGSFRGYWNFDQGGLGDMGQHFLDPVQYFLGKDGEYPVSAESDAPPQDAVACGVWKTATLTYRDGCKVILESELCPGHGTRPFIEGPKGRLWADMRTDPPELAIQAREFPLPEHQEDDFVAAVRERRPFGYGVSEAHHSCTMVSLAALSVRLGRKITLSADGKEIVGDAQAQRLHSPELRKPWLL